MSPTMSTFMTDLGADSTASLEQSWRLVVKISNVSAESPRTQSIGADGPALVPITSYDDKTLAAGDIVSL